MKLVRPLSALMLVLMTACGGGGGGDDDGGGAPTPTRTGTLPTATVTHTPDPNATPTATSPPIVGSALFVRAEVGDDGNDGRSPSQAFRTLAAAIAALPGLSDGRTIVVGPGTYNERIDDIPNGTATQSTVLLADPTGESTQESPGAVVLRGTGDGSMVQLTGRQFVEIDGFVIRGARGGNNAGVDIRTSSNITIRNCEISDGTEQADGIAVLSSNDVLLINNLIFGNGRRGVRIAGGGDGSRGVRLINNTIADNDGQGVVIGTSNAGSEATLLFNIIQDNGAAPDILVTQPSVELYSADTNLVFPGRYDPSDLPQEFDVNDDARFEDPLGGIYLLLPGSPAIDAGFDDIFPEDLLDELQAIKARTTSSTGQDDEGALDLGFHTVSVDGGPIPVARTYYVRNSGDDSRASGRSPDDAFRGIGRALSVARSGDTVIVGPGAYSGRLQIGTVSIEGSPLQIIADPTGVLTEDIPDVVLVDATTVDVGFQFTGAQNVILDGFTIFGARSAGVEIRSNSSNITVRNCFIDGFGRLLDGSGNGISVDDSSNIDLVNNLVSFNDGSGIQLRRTTRTRIINNTIAENGVRGIRVGSGSIGVENTLIQNNIVNFSGAVSIDLNEASAETATLSHNLVFPHEYRPLAASQLPRPTDIDADPGFVAFADYHLSPDSPARNAADGATDPAIRQDLATRTTAEDETPDSDALDIGYHYPILPPPPPTPTPGGRG